MFLAFIPYLHDFKISLNPDHLSEDLLTLDSGTDFRNCRRRLWLLAIIVNEAK